jgi:hypothetical protein
LTETEIAEITEAVENIKWDTRPYSGAISDSKVSATEAGLLAGYDMVQAGTSIPDKKGGTNIVIARATQEKTPFGKAMRSTSSATTMTIADNDILDLGNHIPYKVVANVMKRVWNSDFIPENEGSISNIADLIGVPTLIKKRVQTVWGERYI